MDKSTELLLTMVQEHWEEMRHAENQRSTITNLLIAIAALGTGSVTIIGLSAYTLFLGALLMLLGIYGCMMTAKLYERHQFDQKRLDYWYNQLDKLNPEAQFLALKESADDDHKKNFAGILPKELRFVTKIHTHQLWFFLHTGIALIGLGILVATFFVL